jgi:hypothetical protein
VTGFQAFTDNKMHPHSSLTYVMQWIRC